MKDSKRKILIVEDEESVRKSIVDLLTSFGYDTVAAENGRKAIEVLNSELPDLVISDIMMPEMNGYQLLEHFQKSPFTSNIPFILLTAIVDGNELRKGMESGADDYLTKPFRAKELLKSVEARLKKKERAEKKYDQIFLDISSHIPHELRTPLIPIFGFTDMIKENLSDFSEDEIYEMLDKIKYSGQRLHRTIEKFLKYTESRLRIAGAKSMHEPANSTQSQLLITLTAKKTALRHQRVEDLIIDLAETTLKAVDSDLEFIVEEMVENAIKFSPRGSKIIIKGSVENSFYAIVVTDYGRGMTAEQIKNINAFVQHDRNIYQQNGIGLGLITIKRLTEYYRGSFNISSSQNEFTRCCVKIPVDAPKGRKLNVLSPGNNAPGNYLCS